MITIFTFKKLSPWPKKDNHHMVLESEDEAINFELSYSKSIKPYIGGIISLADIIKVRDFLNKTIEKDTQ